jgi:hypothetical protein
MERGKAGVSGVVLAYIFSMVLPEMAVFAGLARAESSIQVPALLHFAPEARQFTTCPPTRRGLITPPGPRLHSLLGDLGLFHPEFAAM